MARVKELFSSYVGSRDFSGDPTVGLGLSFQNPHKTHQAVYSSQGSMWAGIFLRGKQQGLEEEGLPFILGKYGQLGHKDSTSLDRPCCVEYFVERQLEVRAVTCGPWNTYVYAMERDKS